MMNFQRQDMLYEGPNSQSPNPQRQHPQGLHHQPFPYRDNHTNDLAGYYPQEDQGVRFDVPRFNDNRMTAATMHGNYGGYDMGAQTWNGAAFGNNTMNTLGSTNRMRGTSRGRNPLPSAWFDQPPPMPQVPSFMGLGNNAVVGASPVRTDLGSETEEDLIPTAIVIKNIPFAVKKESLVGLMTDLGLPLPYAFNYHFDNGVFRGLAFANFTSADETAAVIDSLNHYDLQGRKLRVEYKKMLPAAERERIEREKRERRGQLEEQHRPLPSHGLQTQPSMTSMSSHIPATSPSPVSARNTKPDVDLNDPEVLQYYSKLLLFKEDKAKEVLVLPPNLTPPQRRIVHTLAHHMGLSHVSKGVGEQRAVHVYKESRQRLSPPVPQIQGLQGDHDRRALNRAATTDFSDVRGRDGFYGLRHQASGYMPQFQENNLNAQNLRGAKSFADLRSYTPSPVPSTASFPASLSNNVARYQEQNRENGAAPAISNSTEGLLVNGLGNMNLGNGFGNSPRTLRGMMSWDRGNGETPGPIGGHRSFTNNQADEQSRERNQNVPSRQPRGPVGTGFTPRTRQNGHKTRGSDELSQQSSTIGLAE